jgi:hypothetical protein
MSLVFDAPTVAKMAAAIADSAKRTSPSLLVSIQPNGERLPVFGAPGLYGDPAVFCALAEELGDDQPFYGLTAAGFERQPLDDVGEIAARCLTEVKSRQPHGPYSLIGQCTGGYIAVEMAHRLALAGHSIKMLALIDCWPPEWPAPLERWLCGNAVATALHRAGRNYRPPRLQIPMVLLLADILTIPGNDPREWWSRHTTDRVHVLRLPGRDAGEMLRQPAVKAMAEKVRSFLAAA